MCTPALGTEFAHQSLRHHAEQTGRHQKRLHAHVYQPRHGTDGIVGVQRREYQMTRETGLHRDLRCLEVADFSDHDDVGVLAQDRAQRTRETEIDLSVYLRLANDRHDVVAGGIQPRQRCVQRGCFTGAGRSRHQNDPVWLMHEAVQCG